MKLSKVFIGLWALVAVLNLVVFVCWEHTVDKLTLVILFGILVVYQLAFDKLFAILKGFQEVCESYQEICAELHEVIGNYRRMLNEQL